TAQRLGGDALVLILFLVLILVQLGHLKDDLAARTPDLLAGELLFQGQRVTFGTGGAKGHVVVVVVVGAATVRERPASCRALPFAALNALRQHCQRLFGLRLRQG